jgi:putative toxin-antitoxin system antitoxin component (TIGR02293 family)
MAERIRGTASIPAAAAFPAAERRRLGEILVEARAITVDQLAHALTQQPTLGLPLGQTLLKLGYTTDETMRQALSSQLGIPYIDLQNVIIDRSLASLLDRHFAREHAVFPVARIGTALTLAMDDPTATAIVDELARRTGHSITVVTSSADAIQRALVRLYDTPLAAERTRMTTAAADGRRGSTVPPGASALAGSPSADVLPRASGAWTDLRANSGAGRHGYVALLGLMTFELPALLRSIEGGLAWRVFDRFVQETGFDADRVAEFADLSRASLRARREEGRFTRDESDRLVRAARIFGGAMFLFDGDRTTASAWLLSGQPALGGCVPIELARTDLGAREVEAALQHLSRPTGPTGATGPTGSVPQNAPR